MFILSHNIQEPISGGLLLRHAYPNKKLSYSKERIQPLRDGGYLVDEKETTIASLIDQSKYEILGFQVYPGNGQVVDPAYSLRPGLMSM
jgi:hypothetical protein